MANTLDVSIHLEEAILLRFLLNVTTSTPFSKPRIFLGSSEQTSRSIKKLTAELTPCVQRCQKSDTLSVLQALIQFYRSRTT